jgi:hypothetical protein
MPENQARAARKRNRIGSSRPRVYESGARIQDLTALD